MTPKEKAQELVEKYKDYVHGYIGSSMLTNTEYPEQILVQAKRCAIIAVDEIIYHCSQVEPWLGVDFYTEVKQELEKL